MKGHEVMDGIDSIPSTLTDGDKTEIKFVNRTDVVVQAYCSDLNGTMRYKMRLPPNLGEKSEDCTGQNWLVTDEKKNSLFLLGGESPDSVIRGTPAHSVSVDVTPPPWY